MDKESKYTLFKTVHYQKVAMEIANLDLDDIDFLSNILSSQYLRLA